VLPGQGNLVGLFLGSLRADPKSHPGPYNLCNRERPVMSALIRRIRTVAIEFDVAFRPQGILRVYNLRVELASGTARRDDVLRGLPLGDRESAGCGAHVA